MEKGGVEIEEKGDGMKKNIQRPKQNKEVENKGKKFL